MMPIPLIILNVFHLNKLSVNIYQLFSDSLLIKGFLNGCFYSAIQADMCNW